MTASANVLVIETYADDYARHLREAFPSVIVHPVQKIVDIRLDLAAIDVLVAFGIVIDDPFLRSMPRLR